MSNFLHPALKGLAKFPPPEKDKVMVEVFFISYYAKIYLTNDISYSFSYVTDTVLLVYNLY